MRPAGRGLSWPGSRPPGEGRGGGGFPSGRTGFSALEVVVALLLLSALLRLSWGVSSAQRRAIAALVARSDVLTAERTVWWVLRAETAAGRAGNDWRVTGPGVLGLRAFRGRGVPCPDDPGAGEWVDVRYVGWRAPDPAKDSALALDGTGRWTPTALVARGRGEERAGCPARGMERRERWRLRPPPRRPVVLLRVFEPGSYHLEDAAFRYRRGAGGRQPLTAEVLDPEGSGMTAAPEGLEVRFRGLARGPEGTEPAADTGWTRILRGGR